MENFISVAANSKTHTRLQKRIWIVSKKVLKYLKRKNLALEVSIVSDREIRGLNSKYKGKSKATNVLSFPLKDWPTLNLDAKKVRPIGEIYLAPRYIRKRGESLEKMLIHGILHLLGYDHKRKGDTIRMENIEKRVFRRFDF